MYIKTFLFFEFIIQYKIFCKMCIDSLIICIIQIAYTNACANIFINS